MLYIENWKIIFNSKDIQLTSLSSTDVFAFSLLLLTFLLFTIHRLSKPFSFITMCAHLNYTLSLSLYTTTFETVLLSTSSTSYIGVKKNIRLLLSGQK